MLNSIPDDQNSEEYFRLLEARQELWRRSEGWQKIQLGVVVLLPIVGAIIALLLPASRSVVSLGALALALLDALVLDRRYRAAIKKAAKASEHFDVQLFRLPWNRLAAGDPLQAEELAEATRAWRQKPSKRKLKDWYPVRVGDAPLPLARVLCQRTNLFYDSALRRSYSNALTIVLALVALSALGLGLLCGMSVNNVLLAIVLPLSPLIVFALRDGFRQSDAAAANDQIKREAEKLVESVIEGQCAPDDCFQASRELQAAIYARRSANPLVFPGYYDLRRAALEVQMNDGAEEWLKRAGV